VAGTQAAPTLPPLPESAPAGEARAHLPLSRAREASATARKRAGMGATIGDEADFVTAVFRPRSVIDTLLAPR
jgi:hypothetical protein